MKPVVKSSPVAIPSAVRKGYRWKVSLKVAAVRLGALIGKTITPQHLGRVLDGRSPDYHDLVRLYDELVAKHAANATNKRPGRARLRPLAAVALALFLVLSFTR
jgi:hypothetical protein